MSLHPDRCHPHLPRRRRPSAPPWTTSTLDVPAGTVTAVVGPSGSGKSSLLAVAATLIAPDSGTVLIDGVGHIRPVSRSSRGTAAAHDRHRLPAVEPRAVAHGCRATAGDGLDRRALDPRGEVPSDGVARSGRHGGSGRPPTASVLRWPAAAGQHRPRPDERAECASGRRTDERPRSGARRGDRRTGHPVVPEPAPPPFSSRTTTTTSTSPTPSSRSVDGRTAGTRAAGRRPWPVAPGRSGRRCRPQWPPKAVSGELGPAVKLR